jgi:hypothetical protein
VLEAENPLQAAVERVSQTFSVVGENDNLQLLLLALTTRIFSQPVNVLVVGGTGQGKSFLTTLLARPCHLAAIGALSARPPEPCSFTRLPKELCSSGLNFPNLVATQLLPQSFGLSSGKHLKKRRPITFSLNGHPKAQGGEVSKCQDKWR